MSFDQRNVLAFPSRDARPRTLHTPRLDFPDSHPADTLEIILRRIRSKYVGRFVLFGVLRAQVDRASPFHNRFGRYEENDRIEHGSAVWHGDFGPHVTSADGCRIDWVVVVPCLLSLTPNFLANPFDSGELANVPIPASRPKSSLQQKLYIESPLPYASTFCFHLLNCYTYGFARAKLHPYNISTLSAKCFNRLLT